ncbi:MAG: hypothetical protein VR64_22250 [Desulfatitalea sp. BRH_c12]|nr:MAG: hypothetical protein VR64_22250 [Desulfatitalea sp. BRH_c12]
MSKWYKTDFKGVRYRKHPTRKHGVQMDHYYVITYKFSGRTITEAVGWATDGNKPSDAFELLRKLKRNQKTGKGPCTLAEMREESEAEKMAKRRELAAEELRNISFKTFFKDTFLPDSKTRWKPETTRKAEEHVKNWIDPVTGATPMREIGLTQVNRIRGKLADAGRSARMQQYVFRTFAMVWNAALDHGLVDGPSPTKSGSFRLPKVDNERQRYLTIDEENKLLAEVLKKSKQAHDMAVVSLDAGLRFGEVASLTWGCVDKENGLLRILDTKSGRDRNVPMTMRLNALFESMMSGNSSDLVFPPKTQKPKQDGTASASATSRRQRQIPSSFKRGLEDAKLNEGVENPKMRASFHTLRHTCASRMVQAGVDLYRVQRLLGHSTPVMTARYSKLADDDLRQAVVAMEQDGKIRKSKGKVIKFYRKDVKIFPGDR